MRSYSYTNSAGDTYHLHAVPGQKGQRLYVIRKRPGSLATLPRGYEIRENIHGQVSIRRVRRRVIAEPEERLIRNHLTRLRPRGYVLDVVGHAATVWASALDRKSFADSLDAEFANGFADALNKALADKYSPDLVAVFRERRRGQDQRRPRFYPLLRFVVASKVPRLFAVERVCFTGDSAWARLEVLPLAPAIMKYLPHVGRDSFFDLL